MCSTPNWMQCTPRASSNQPHVQSMLCPLFNEQSCRILNADREPMASPMLAFDMLSRHLPNRMNEISVAASWAFSSTINLTTEVTTDDKRILLSHVQQAFFLPSCENLARISDSPKHTSPAHLRKGTQRTEKEERMKNRFESTSTTEGTWGRVSLKGLATCHALATTNHRGMMTGCTSCAPSLW